MGVLASHLRRPPLKVVLKRADGKLATATRDELHGYLHLSPHANVARVVDVVDFRGVVLLAVPYEPLGTLRQWLHDREASGVAAWRSNVASRAAPGVDVGYVTRGFAPRWGAHTIRRQPHRPPAGRSKVSSAWASPKTRARSRSTSPHAAPPSTADADATASASALSRDQTRRDSTGSDSDSESRSESESEVDSDSVESRGRDRGVTVVAPATGHRDAPRGAVRRRHEAESFEVNHDEVATRALLALQVARGLQHIHTAGDASLGRGFLHLDLHA
jgi:hypothetical protein